MDRLNWIFGDFLSHMEIDSLLWLQLDLRSEVL